MRKIVIALAAIIIFCGWQIIRLLPKDMPKETHVPDARSLMDLGEQEWTVILAVELVDISQNIEVINTKGVTVQLTVKKTHRQFDELENVETGDIIIVHHTDELMDATDPKNFSHVSFEIKKPDRPTRPRPNNNSDHATSVAFL